MPGTLREEIDAIATCRGPVWRCADVWMPPVMQVGFEQLRACDRVRSCVRPWGAALTHAAGRYGDAWTRSKS